MQCNLGQPCSNCIRRYPPVDCIYALPDLRSARRSSAVEYLLKSRSVSLENRQIGGRTGCMVSYHRQEQSIGARSLHMHGPGLNFSELQGSNLLSQLLSPFSDIENGKVNRAQIVALNEDFLSIDLMNDMNSGFGNPITLYGCVCQLTNRSDTLDAAIQALCLVQLAVRKQDRRLKEESLLMRATALKKLRLSLRSSQSAYTLETMVASLCLKTYEVCLFLLTQ